MNQESVKLLMSYFLLLVLYQWEIKFPIWLLIITNHTKKTISFLLLSNLQVSSFQISGSCLLIASMKFGKEPTLYHWEIKFSTWLLIITKHTKKTISFLLLSKLQVSSFQISGSCLLIASMNSFKGMS